MNSTEQRLANDPDGSFSNWLNEVKAKFDNYTQYKEAESIYSFATAYECGQNSNQAFMDYWNWVNSA